MTHRRSVLVTVVVLLAAACGDDGVDDPVTTTTTTTIPAVDDESTTTTEATPPEVTTTATEAEDDVVHVVVTIAEGDVTVTVDGEPLRGRVMVSRGQMVRIDFSTDVHEELHVHGYDHLLEAQPGTDTSVEFVANIPGIFEVERHFAGHLRIFDIQVE